MKLSDPVTALYILIAADYGEKLGGTAEDRRELFRLGWLKQGDLTEEGYRVLAAAIIAAGENLVDSAAQKS